jgi:hypothetical protein
MKTTFTRFAIAIACCLTLLSSCKKDDDGGDTTPTPTPTATTNNHFMLHGHKYVVYDMMVISSTADNYYVLSTWSAYQGDTLSADIAFMSSQPTVGAYSLDPMSNKAYMSFENNAEYGDAESGTCTVSKVNGHYKFVFTNISFFDEQTETSVKVSGEVINN